MKIGEGTYANVYKGKRMGILAQRPILRCLGCEIDRQRCENWTEKYVMYLFYPLYKLVLMYDIPSVAIKKIKTSAAWKDGIDMSALREIKFLRELAHPNVIAVSLLLSLFRLRVST